MNSRQKMVQQSFLDDEAGILRLLYRSYSEALEGIKAGIEEKYEAIAELTEEINDLPPNDPKRVVLEGRRMAKVYQKQYQESLERQVSGILGDMDAKNYTNVMDYLEGCYDNGFLGAMYDIHGQGIPLTLPINQQKAVHAVQTDSKISEGLYRRLGKDTADLKRKITSQVSRSMVMGESYGQCAQALERQTEIGFNRAARIARTEGHRIQVTAAMDALYDAREAGADVVKQWDATLDKRTRRSHARCDGEIRELDDTFGNGLMCPGDPKGPASEVVNCRCALLQRARWALDESELATLKERAAYFGLDKADSFKEFKKRYILSSSNSPESEWEYGMRYGIEASYANADYLRSDEYKAKFYGLTGNRDIDDLAWRLSTSAIEENNGTSFETMFMVDLSNGSYIRSNERINHGIIYSDDMLKWISDSANGNRRIMAIHNHPLGVPPSLDDFVKATENRYEVAIAVGHNGQVYDYGHISIPSKESIEFAHQLIAELIEGGYDIDRAHREIYEQFGASYSIRR